MALRRGAAVLVVLGAAAYVLVHVTRQWDLGVYLRAAEALQAGRNPYVAASDESALPFLYPPGTLWLLTPLTWLPRGVAPWAWLAAKGVVLVWLLRIWRQALAPIEWSLVVPVALFAFDAALLWDLRVGNVAVFEAALIWCAFGQFREGRLGRFALALGFASIWKVWPLAFLGALWLTEATPKERARNALVGGIPVLAVALPGSNPSGMWLEALSRAARLDLGNAEVEPSVRRWIAGAADSLAPGAAPVWLAGGALLVFSILLLALGWRAAASYRFRGDSLGMLSVCATLWILLAPRVMIYSYIVLLPAALYVVRETCRTRTSQFVCYGLLCIQGLGRLLPGPPVPWLAPMPLALALACFAGLCVGAARPGRLVDFPGRLP